MQQHVSLKSMAEAKTEGIQKATHFKVDPSKVEFEPGFNLRDEGPELEAHLESMYQAMKAGASFPPIDVSIIEGRIIASDGHCRTRTACRLIAEGIPYMLEARQFRGNEAERVCHMLGSAQGKALSPLEAGRGFARLLRYGMTVGDIAKRLGISRTTVDNGLALAESPVEVQQMLSAGSVSVQVVQQTIAKHGTDAPTVLKDAVSKAQASGIKKVTAKHVSEKKSKASERDRLVDVVRDLLDVAQNILADDLIQYLPSEYIAKVRAAIAKATGAA